MRALVLSRISQVFYDFTFVNRVQNTNLIPQIHAIFSVLINLICNETNVLISTNNQLLKIIFTLHLRIIIQRSLYKTVYGKRLRNKSYILYYLIKKNHRQFIYIYILQLHKIRPIVMDRLIVHLIVLDPYKEWDGHRKNGDEQIKRLLNTTLSFSVYVFG